MEATQVNDDCDFGTHYFTEQYPQGSIGCNTQYSFRQMASTIILRNERDQQAR